MDLILFGLLSICGIVLAVPLTFQDVKRARAIRYKAAVYEHAVHIPWDCLVVPVPRDVALWNMERNIRVYEEQAQRASQQGVNIIVFPEDGIYGMIFNRNTIKPFLEDIPDPQLTEWIPYTLPESVLGVEVQRRLSHMAKANTMYVVANMGDRKSCNHSNDSTCPSDGQYQYNTDVVFDPTGRLIARYHKRHLFKESQFDTPDLEVVTFNTPFGLFGLFTCFDILFYHPAVELVRKHGVRNVIFPTAWMDELPYLAAIQYHSAFAKGLGVNVLAANIHFPIYKFQGSGIYTPFSNVNYYYDDSIFSGGKLLISDVDSLDENGLTEIDLDRGEKFITKITNGLKPLSNNLLSGHLNTEKGGPKSDNNNAQYQNHDDKEIGQRMLDHGHLFKRGFVHGYEMSNFKLPRQNYTFTPLRAQFGMVNACEGYMCCFLQYAQTTTVSYELFVLAAFSGYDDGRFTEICAVLKCPGQEDTCGEAVFTSDTSFTFLQLSGDFNSLYLFPEVLVANGDSIGIVQGEWNYSQNAIDAPNGFSKPLISASLFARDYSRDNVT